ncbi:hypothetical protein CAEBREN_15507 [Caenorhabditis brenneri]|uniref:Uncharacterized protein n=1 Tax=Caenorhabditis brenneri TaxID=135651 RepID=G0P369_CAEBE|nr:hypothetical protein CAEBREN_15507 [Caenorhabditis brenneri]
MEHLTDQQIMERLAKASEGEGPKFQRSVVAGIAEKKEYMSRPHSAATIQRAARPTTTATRVFRPYPKECLPVDKRREREDGFLEILAVMAKVGEEEEKVPGEVAKGEKAAGEDVDPEDVQHGKTSSAKPESCGEPKKVGRPKKRVD